MKTLIKNKLLILFVLTTTIFSCPKPGKEIEGCTDINSFNYNVLAETDNGSCIEMFGCLGYSSQYSNSGTIGVTLRDPYYDQKINEEVYLQRNFFNGIPAEVYILYEPSPSDKNAYASQDGRILFGFHMFYYTISNYNELAAAGILAHEWGHRAQQTLGWNSSNKNPEIELEADAFSGYYMALAKSFAWSQIQGYYSSTYATGDYNFHHPTHHGTPNQRLASAYLGVQTAIDAINNNTPYSYNELHQIFMSTINNEITSNNKNSGKIGTIYTQIASGQSKGKNISIPKGILEKERKKYYPSIK